MNRPSVSSLPLPDLAFREEVATSRRRGERGRQLILWGWLITMAGVGLYCRAIYAVGLDAAMLDPFTRTGLLGWSSATTLLGGVVLWLLGNLRYLREAMDA